MGGEQVFALIVISFLVGAFLGVVIISLMENEE